MPPMKDETVRPPRGDTLSFAWIQRGMRTRHFYVRLRHRRANYRLFFRIVRGLDPYGHC